MRLLRLAACILHLVLTLGAPAAFASPAPTAGSGDLLLQLRSFLLSLWGDEGCRIDPWGICSTAPRTLGKAGCEIDPWGRCLSDPKATPLRTLTAKEGCEIDPWGRCIAAPKAIPPHVLRAKEGCELDPWGKCITRP